VGQSRFAGLVEPALNFIAWFTKFETPDHLTSLIESCQTRLISETFDPRQLKVLVPAIIRLTLIVGEGWDQLWDYFSAWSVHPQRKIISPVMWTELAAHVCDPVKQMILQMCGDKWWKVELMSTRGQQCFEKALDIMTEEEVLLAIGTIVGENQLLEHHTDWFLLAIACKQRQALRDEIREILADKRPRDERYIRGELALIFGEEDEFEEEDPLWDTGT
jgi:hypothetical protein